jgi:hypothetical protein
MSKTMEQKQTAVEWLESQINLGLSERGLISAIKQAKQMEKEQIVESHHDGYNDGYLKNNASSAKYYYENYK